jgi:signal peptidase II
MKHSVVVGGAIVSAFLVDRVAKMFAQSLLTRGEFFAIDSVAGFVGFVPTVNRVGAFSLPVANGLVLVSGLLVAVVLVVMLWRARAAERRILSFVLLGAASNLADRVFFGGVIDYLSFSTLFPAFNIADLMILGGVVAWWSAVRVRG